MPQIHSDIEKTNEEPTSGLYCHWSGHQLATLEVSKYLTFPFLSPSLPLKTICWHFQIIDKEEFSFI
jgi:hypothetical protein